MTNKKKKQFIMFFLIWPGLFVYFAIEKINNWFKRRTYESRIVYAFAAVIVGLWLIFLCGGSVLLVGHLIG